jgi:PAS domain S-box-containing protein
VDYDILKKAINQSVDLIGTIQRDGRFSWLNQASFGLLGYQPDELKDKHFTELVPEAHKTDIFSILEQVMKGFVQPAFDLDLNHKNGSFVSLQWSLSWDESDQLLYCVARNKTEIKRTQEELQSSKDNYKYLFENNPSPMFIWDAETLHILDGNGEAFRKYGYTKEEFLSLSILDIRPPEDIPKILEVIQNASDYGMITKKTWRHLRKTGELMLLEITSHMMTYNGRNAYFVLINDISEREGYLSLLQENEEKLLKAQKIARLGFWQFNYMYQSPYWSSEVFNIWGVSPLEFEPGMEALLKTIHPEDVSFFKLTMEALQTGNYKEDFEFRILLPDGSFKWILCTPEKDLTNQKNNKTINATVQDISQMKMAQIQLEERNRFIETAIENIPIGIAVNKIKEGSTTLINRKFGEVYGWPPEVLTDIPAFFKHVYPDEVYRKEISERILRDIQSGDINRMNWENISITTQTGEVRIVNAKNIPIYDQNLMISTVMDVTNQRKAENELKISNERYNYVTKATSDAIWDKDLANNTIIWGEGYQTIFGYLLLNDYGVLEKWTHAIHPNDVDRVLETFETAVKGKDNRYFCDYRFMKANGTYAFVEDKGFIIRDASGNALRMVGAMQDITRQKIEVLQKELFNEISKIFNETQHISESLKKVVNLIGLTESNYSLVELWMIGEDEADMSLSASYWGDENPHKFFKDEGALLKVQSGEGFAGTVWKTRSVQSWKVKESNAFFLSAENARMEGLKSVFAIPLFNFKQIVGVLLFGLKEDLMAEDQLYPFAERLGYHLGSEIKRKKLEYELHQVFSFSQDIICIAGLDGYFKKVNPAATRILEYTEKELLSVPFRQMIYQEDVENTNQYLSDYNNLEGNVYFENRYKTKTGKIIWIAWTTSYSPSDELLYGVGKDITEQRNLQALLDNATNLALIGGWEIDLIHQAVVWSPMTRKINEVGNDFQPDFENTFHFIPSKKEKISLRRAFDKAINKGQQIDEELLIITGKKNQRWVRVIGEPEMVAGKCVKISGSFQDIHDLKSAEIASNQSRQRLIGTLESIQDGFYELDKDWTITYWNNEAERLFQKKREDVLGTNLWESFSEAVSLKFYSEYQCALNEKIPVRFEEYYPPLQRWYDMSVFPSENGLTVFSKDITDRKKSEQELLMFKMVMENSKDCIGISDSQGRALYANPEFQDMLGISTEYPVEGLTLSNVYEDLLQAKEVFGNLMDGKYWKGEVNLLSTGKDIMPFYFSGGPIFNQKKQLIGAFGIHTDISELKKAENKLLNALIEKNTILESIGDAFFSTDIHWTVTHWNRQAELLLAMPRDQIIGKNLWEVFNDEIDTIFYKNYFKSLETGTNISFEEYYARTQKWFDVSAYPSVSGLSIYFRDITERKKGEKALHESNERFQKVSEATNDAIWDWDIINQSLYWGEGFYKLLRIPVEELVPTIDIWRSLIHPDDRETKYISLQKALDDPKVENWQFEYRFKTSENEYAFVINRGIIIRNELGDAIRMVGALTDMTQRKMYEESLENLNTLLDQRARELVISNEELEQFAFVASHDLQEPLRMVTSFLSQLEKKYKESLDDKGQLYIRLAVDGAVRMREIILDLLEYSRIGKENVELESINLKEVIEEIKTLYHQTIQEKGATIMQEDLPVILNKKFLIFQIFQNLISNALKYSKPDTPPLVQITASLRGGNWVFSVKDNGIGIEEDYHDKIFVMFQRLHGREEYAGTGIGLAIVKKTIERLGGQIWVESKKEEGSNFIFTISEKA